MIKLVIDTNVLISALLFKNSIPFPSVKFAEKQAIILYSQATLDELALSGNANVIVTGDLDLLILNPFQNTKIMTPDVFINQYSRSKFSDRFNQQLDL